MKAYFFTIGIIAIVVAGYITYTYTRPETTIVSSILVQYDYRSLIKDSDYIVTGRVKTITPKTIESEIRKGEQDIYSIVDLEIEKVLSPSDSDIKALSIKNLGGTIGSKTMKSEDSPDFTSAEKVLVFLHKDTVSDYYEVTGLIQGKYDVSDAGAIGITENQRTMARKVFGRDMTIAELEALIQ